MVQIDKERKLRKLLDEEWKEVPGSDGKYKISNYGRVKSFYNNKDEGKLLKNHSLKGFCAISLRNVTFSKYVHKLVALTWLERPSEEYIYVVHLDSNLKNNYYKNLKWTTQEETYKRHSDYMIDRSKRLSKKELITASKLKEDDVKLLKSMLQRGIAQNVIAKLFKVSEMQITRIKRGENWGHILV